MQKHDLGDFVASVVLHLKPRGARAVRQWQESVEAGFGGDLILRAPVASKDGQPATGTVRILPEAFYRTEGFAL